ncbi:MAG: hypothetical protein JW717_13840 [Marinilabiliaceae bacterium]|nr:hypothetical protein [Marinilabiliaceae bacterium]
MKLKLISHSFLYFIFLWSCQPDNESTLTELQTKYLKSYEVLTKYSEQDAKSIFSLVGTFSNEPDLISYSNNIISGVTVFYIEYQSEYINNQPILLSGLVLVPNTISDNLLLMSFQNGTILKHNEAPSANINNFDYKILHAAAGLGMVICIPDYIGFGSSKEYKHPYLHKLLFQRTITDMIKAVKEMDENKLLEQVSLSGDLFLSGYSLGGWASLVAHKEIENNPIDGINLKGSACGSGSYNLLIMKDFIFNSTDFIQPFYVPYIISGYKSTNEIDGDFSIYLNSPYDNITSTMFDGTYSTNEVNNELTSNMQEMLTRDMIIGFDTASNMKSIKQALINNSQFAWQNTKPLHLYHGTDDVHVPYAISDSTYADFIKLGQSENKIKFTSLNGKDHTTGLLPMYIKVLDDLLQIVQ